MSVEGGGYLIKHNAWNGDHTVAICDTMDEVRKWFVDNPNAHSAYYNVYPTPVDVSQWRRPDER